MIVETNSAMSSINRHAGRLSVLMSLFSSTVVLSQFSASDDAQWPLVPFALFYALAHWLLHMACHIAVNVADTRTDVLLTTKKFVPHRSHNYKKAAAREKRLVELANSTWQEALRRQLKDTTQNIEILYFSVFAVLPHTLNFFSGLLSPGFAKWSFCFFQLAGFLYIIIHLVTRLLPSVITR